MERKLIFYLGDVSFLLDLAAVVEVCEQFVSMFDDTQTDLARGIVGALNFRMSHIPVVDPTMRLAIRSRLPWPDKVALVLKSAEGGWAVLVDRVGEVVPTTRLYPCEISPLLKKAVKGYYSQVYLLKDEPMIVFNPELFYGATAVDI